MTFLPKGFLAALLLALLAAAGIRAWSLCAMDRLLPLEGLYVDERSFTGAPSVPGSGVFARPPGMFALSLLLGAGENPVRARIVMSVLSLIPAAALLASARGRRRPGWTVLCASALAACPLTVLAGTQLLPEIPAAALIALALLASFRRRMLLAGFLLGAAALFRAELLLSVPLMLLLSLRGPGGLRAWGALAGGCAAAVGPVLLLNLIAGGGPVIAANGAENLWLGTSWELITTPPGIEFEELVAVGVDDPGLQAEFSSRARDAILSDPGGWALMGLQKGLAFLTLPGPGRNIETGWILRTTGLLFLLPISFAAVILGGSRCMRGSGGAEGTGRLAVSILAAGLLSAVVFFPAARFRVPLLPAFWFLAAARTPDRRDVAFAIPLALLLAVLAFLYRYPGMERSGLTSLLAAEQRIASGLAEEAQEELHRARGRGFEGADLDNLSGIALSMAGSPGEGLASFRAAVSAAPRSPTAWKNLAVSLWNLGRDAEAGDAARTAVGLNPLLLGTLRPILDTAPGGAGGDGP